MTYAIFEVARTQWRKSLQTCPPAEGFEGYQCTTCSKGYFQQGFSCAPCPKDGTARFGGLVGGVAVLIILAAGLLFRLRNKIMSLVKHFESELTIVSIGIQYAQVIGIFSTVYTVPWGRTTKSTFQLFQFVNLNLDFLSPQCAVGASYSVLFYSTLALPVLVAVVLLTLFAGIVLVQKCNKEVSSLTERLDASILIATGISIFRVTQLILLKKAFEAFDCDPLTGIFLHDPSQNCYTTYWYGLAVSGAITIGLCAAIIPVTLFTALCSCGCHAPCCCYGTYCRKALGCNCLCCDPRCRCGCDRCCICSCSNGDYDTLYAEDFAANKWDEDYYDVKVVKREYEKSVVFRYLGSLYSHYKTKHFLWEMCVVVRKIVIVAAANFIPNPLTPGFVPIGDASVMTCAFLACVFLASALIELAVRPYKARAHNVLETVLFFCAAAVMGIGILFTRYHATPYGIILDILTAFVLVTSVVCVIVITFFSFIRNCYRKCKKMKEEKREEKEAANDYGMGDEIEMITVGDVSNPTFRTEDDRDAVVATTAPDPATGVYVPLHVPAPDSRLSVYHVPYAGAFPPPTAPSVRPFSHPEPSAPPPGPPPPAASAPMPDPRANVAYPDPRVSVTYPDPRASAYAAVAHPYAYYYPQAAPAGVPPGHASWYSAYAQPQGADPRASVYALTPARDAPPPPSET